MRTEKLTYRRNRLVAIIIFGLLVWNLQLFGQEKSDVGQLELRARELVENLRQGNYEMAGQYFDQTMKKQATPPTLKMIWESLKSQVGALKEIKGPRYEAQGQYDFIYVTSVFEKQTLDLRVVFNKQAEIAGFSFVPHLEVKESPPPPYAKPDLFQETEVQVRTGDWILPGTLTRPRGQGPFPAVVLVHGSGPNDRDETVGPNKPFRDIAWGLASKGIAVLRYEKRTKFYGQKLSADRQSLSSFTVNEETVDDAASAVALFRQTEGIDPDRVFVLGHSLGGMLIPRIAQKARAAAGFIIMAGLTRPIEDAILEQTRYLLALQGLSTEESKKKLQELEGVVNRIKALTEVDKNSTEILLGAAPAYWLDIRDYRPIEDVRKIEKPILILQGKRDYQVTEVDFKAWRQALSDRQNVTFKLYPACNHLFMEGKGLIIPDEYLYRAGNVSEEVINDIAGWILSINR
ncbi:MAG: alpha/beta hydrolase [Candidatus Saccharicenans sp.]|uniref:alpha/beta hydrolase n=1 Tax=Candidatus Saccharicenans sp. TaxID=2819258 RepID=UPI00404A2B9F